jgi:non-specific serine/threonine protein kinase
VGARAPGAVGKDALLDFSSTVTLDGEPLTEAELAELLAGSDGLRLLRGRWIELDRVELRATLERLRAIERAAAGGGVGFAEAMRLVAGAAVTGDSELAAATHARVIAGPWLAETLARLRSPEGIAAAEPSADLHAQLRPYQAVGVRWLHLLSQLGLGACLADDMGLGKTIQVIALLLASRSGRVKPPHLLVAPASLLGNWIAELARFAPSMRAVVAHPSAMAAADLASASAPDLAGTDLVITSYGTVARAPWLASTCWGLVITDLPDKTELTAYCSLSRKQAALYQQAVDDLAARLQDSDGIARRGAVLAALVRFKTGFARCFGDQADAAYAWARAHAGPEGRHLKLRRIALENVSHVL